MGRIRQPSTAAVVLGTLLLCPYGVKPAAGQDAVAPPRDEPTISMGLPETWRPELGAAFYFDRDDGEKLYGTELQASLFRPLGNPVAGFGLQMEGFYRAVGARQPNGGARLMIPIRYLGLAWGWEYDIRRETVQSVISVTTPLWRGGPFRQGSRFRFDWSGSTFRAGLTFPLRRRWMGTSRPRSTRPSLPDPPRRRRSQGFEPPIAEGLNDLRVAARWVNDLTAPFFDQWSTNDFLESVEDLKTAIDEPDDMFPEGHTFEAAIDLYHHEIGEAFRRAGGGDPTRGELVTSNAREILLDHVILPYNRLLGQRKRHDSLTGLGVDAGARFSRWVEESGAVPTDRQATVREVFDEVVEIMDENRRVSRGHWADSRSVWVPLHYALRLEDHDTQVEIDALIERAVEKSFSKANEVSYVINQQFHIELERQILEAEDYHVLWIHDFKGKNAVGDPDRVGLEFVVNAYLRALINGVRAFDERGTLPQHIIMLDQFFYAGSDGARWMKLLQDPLTHTVDLPGGFESWEQKIHDVQQELRDAVARSTTLQAGLRAYGPDWLENQVKVHVNITNPVDPSFTSAHMLPGLIFLPDDMMRDHRKIAFYDVTETDPAKGEAIFSGMGVAEHYIGGTWEDRAVLVRGPAILDVKAEARRVLLQQGFTEDEIPRALKPRPRPDDYEAKVAALLETRGIYSADALQLHNATGYGQKWSTVARAMLYDLMPGGSTIIIPDSLWNSPLWQSMLVGNALRGGRVFVIVPSVKNSPGDPAPVISRANEIFARFLVIQQELGEQIEQTGGVLRTGIYDVEGAFDLIDELTDLIATWRNPDPALFASFPFDPSLLEAAETLRDELVDTGYQTASFTEDAVRRDPKIHLKSQILISREVVESLVPRPDLVRLVDRHARLRAEQLATLEGSARALQLEMEAEAEAVLVDWWNGLSEESRAASVAYLSVGSHNMDVRGQVMDGEVSMLVSGLGAMTAYLNFLYLASVTTWVESVEELETMLPPANAFIRWLGRYAKNAL